MNSAQTLQPEGGRSLIMRKSLLACLSLSVVLAACGDSTPVANTDNTGREEAGSILTETSAIRQCGTLFSPTGTTDTQKAGALTAFFMGGNNSSNSKVKPVNGREGPATICFKAYGSGNYATGFIRVEYEDTYGVTSFQMDQDKTFWGKVEGADDGSTKVQMIFKDSVGFVEIKGSAPASGQFTGTFRYYFFPSYESALSAQIQEAQQKCKTGVYTVAQCLGYNFPSTFWWNTPYVSEKQRLLDQALAILNDTSKTKTMGTFSADVTEVFGN